MKRFVIIGRDQCENNPALWPLVQHLVQPESDSIEVPEHHPDLVEILLRADSVIWATELAPGEKIDPAIKGFQRIVGNISQ